MLDKPPKNAPPVTAPATWPSPIAPTKSHLPSPLDPTIKVTLGGSETAIAPLCTEIPDFLLEKDLRDFLARNLSQAFGEPLELLGTEHPVDVGRVDLLARDTAKTIWVIELKNRTCSREVIGQVLSYVGAIRREYPSSPVRGVVVGPSFDEGALAALEASIDITFYEFRIRYELSVLAKSPVFPSIERTDVQISQRAQKEWVIDVPKRLIYRRSNAGSLIDLYTANIEVGKGIAIGDDYIPFDNIELTGDGLSVGEFRKYVVNGEEPIDMKSFLFPSWPFSR